MSDPLSVAAAVAGLVALTGTVSKSVFQFVTSIKDAPIVARNLVRSLYTLNVALGQIQQNLLNPDFVAETNDKDVEDLQQCLANCTAVFAQLQKRVEDCRLGSQGQHLPRKTWESVKWSFTDDALEDILERVEAQKATLQLLISAFTAKVTTGLLRYAKQTEARTRHMSRQLKDITVTLQWLLPRVQGVEQRTEMISSAEQGAIESSVFAASSAYSAEELANLLRASGSSLSLALDTSNDDIASVLWQPETERSLEPRASLSRASTALPLQDGSGRLRQTDSLMSPAATSAMIQVRKTRSSWLRKAPSLSAGSGNLIRSVVEVIQFGSATSNRISELLIAKRTTEQLKSDYQEIAARAESLSGLMEFMAEAGEETLDAWTTTQSSLREYCICVTRALDRAREGADFNNALQESEWENLRQAAIRNLENVHKIAHASFMKQTINSQKSQEERLDTIISHMSVQFEALRSDMRHITRPVQRPNGSLPLSEGEAIEDPKEQGGHLNTADNRLSKLPVTTEQ